MDDEANLEHGIANAMAYNSLERVRLLTAVSVASVVGLAAGKVYF
jgi:hypothetical protein